MELCEKWTAKMPAIRGNVVVLVLGWCGKLLRDCLVEVLFFCGKISFLSVNRGEDIAYIYIQITCEITHLISTPRMYPPCTLKKA